MGIFAWRNLLTRPIRTILALVGLSIPVLGVLGLFAVSNSLRNLVGDTLGGIEGLVVLSDNALSPVLSNVPASLPDELQEDADGPGRRAGGLGPGPVDRGAGHDRRHVHGQADVDLRPARDRRPGHRVAPEPPQRHLPQGPARARRGAVPPARRRGEAEHRHQPEDRPRASRRAGPAPQGGRHPEDRRQAVQDRRHLRDRLDAAGRRHHHGHRDGPRGPQPARGVALVHLRRGGGPAQNDDAGRGDREGPPRLRRPQHGRGPGQLQHACWARSTRSC